MRVTIFGASGLLGTELAREWTGDEIAGLSSRDVDIRDAAGVEKSVTDTRPDWIILAAAYTDVDGCERDPDRGFSVNRDGAVNVAQAAMKNRARLLFLSSDYVFDGTQSTPYETTDARSPLGVYGRSKAEAEVRLQELVPDCCIARTSWLFGTGGKCFPDTILKLAASRSVLDVVNDQRGCPTYAPDLAKAIIALCRRDAVGIVHVTNRGDCTWFEFAREIMCCANVTTEVRPVTSQQMPRPAPRPAYSVLSSASLKRLGIEMPDWHDALRRYLQERVHDSRKRS